MQEVIESLNYVVDGHLFWQSMGMTTATAIFIGAILFHESNKSTFQKAVYSVVAYSMFLIFTSVARVQPNISSGIISTKTYASALTTLLVTLAYILGLLIGYYLLKGRDARRVRSKI